MSTKMVVHTKLDNRVKPTDKLFISGVEVVVENEEDSPTRVLAYHKVAGEVSTLSDPQGRPTIYDRLPQDLLVGKWVSVGRLDINTTGLILFSNDGGLVHGLTHPSRVVPRQYSCRVWGDVTQTKLNKLRSGVRSKNDLLQFDNVKLLNSAGGSNKWYQVTLKRGKNREIRRAWEAVGCKVNRLIRTRYGSVQLPKYLEEGRWIELSRKEIEGLKSLIEI